MFKVINVNIPANADKVIVHTDELIGTYDVAALHIDGHEFENTDKTFKIGEDRKTATIFIFNPINEDCTGVVVITTLPHE